MARRTFQGAVEVMHSLVFLTYSHLSLKNQEIFLEL